MAFHLIDWIIVLVYAAVVLTVGLYLVKKPKTSEGYFLANRSLRWPFIGASMLASNISAEHFVGLAGAGFGIGMAIGAAYEWAAIFCLTPLILIFLPLYMKNKIYTVPEYLEKRFSGGVRNLLAWMMVVMSVLTKISISLWASALVFQTLFGWDPVVVIWVVGLVTAAYTMKGGLSAVIYTDAIQVVVLLIAGAVLTVLGLNAVGGWEALQAKVPAELFHVVKPVTDPDVPWTGVVLGIWIGASFYWSMDQVLVQRVFAARTLNEGRKGAIFTGFLKLLIPFILVLPGIIARALYPEQIGDTPDAAYPTMLKNLMPHGLLGLTVAGISAALMGHLSATYNSISTMCTRDFYVKLRPQATHAQQIWVGRLVVLAVALLGILWAPQIKKFGNLWEYLQNVSFYLMMPFVAVFFMGALSKRVNAQGVWASILTGFVLGGALFVDRMRAPEYGHFLPFMNKPWMAGWLHGAVAELIVCLVVLWVVSLATPAPPAEKVATTVLSRETFHGEEPAPANFLSDYRFWLALAIVLTSSFYYIWR